MQQQLFECGEPGQTDPTTTALLSNNAPNVHIPIWNYPEFCREREGKATRKYRSRRKCCGREEKAENGVGFISTSLNVCGIYEQLKFIVALCFSYFILSFESLVSRRRSPLVGTIKDEQLSGWFVEILARIYRLHEMKLPAEDYSTKNWEKMLCIYFSWISY